jgi:hypothetical protein
VCGGCWPQTLVCHADALRVGFCCGVLEVLSSQDVGCLSAAGPLLLPIAAVDVCSNLRRQVAYAMYAGVAYLYAYCICIAGYLSLTGVLCSLSVLAAWYPQKCSGWHGKECPCIGMLPSWALARQWQRPAIWWVLP